MQKNEETVKLDTSNLNTILNEEEFYSKPLNAETNIFKRIFLLNVQDYMNNLYTEIVSKDIKFNFSHTPPLQDNQKIEVDKLENLLNQKSSEITKLSLFKLFFLQQKSKFALILFVLALFSISKCGISILLSTLIDSIQQDLPIKYAYGIGLVLLNGLSIICQHQFYSIGYEYSTIVRMSMANILYHKIFKLHTYQIKNTNQGKIINMISADLNLLEPFLIYMFVVLNLPIALGLTAAILWIRFDGPQGLLLLALLFLAYPIQLFFTHRITVLVKKTKEYADQRVKLTNEFIEGIRLIKMYAWEQSFIKSIRNLAHQEHFAYILTHLQYVILRGTTFFSQMWASAIFFMIMHYGEFYEINVSIMLSTLQLAAFARFFCVNLSSFGLDFIANLKIVLERMRVVLSMEEITQTQQLLDYQQKEDGLVLHNLEGYWNVQGQPQIKLSFKFNIGLYAVIGKIGSGKSSLLNAIIGEMPKTTGSILLNGDDIKNRKVGYVEQEPFIFPASFKENILFGRPMDECLYQLVLEQSNLIMDLQNMEKGDSTMIGEKGLTLSGGQKARLSLARALYEDAEIYLLDDPLSAVDAKVSRSIFNNLKQLAKQRIIILVTHQVQFAPECDQIIIMNEGQIMASGEFKDVNQHLNLITDTFSQQEQQVQYKNNVTKQDNELYKKEELTSKPVTFDTYKRFIKQWSCPFLLIIMIIFYLGQEVLLQLYIFFISEYEEEGSFFLLIGMLCIGALILNLIKYGITTFSILSGTKQTHDQMINSLSQSPISYFDTNPSGRILNRFSNDKSLCDFTMNLSLWEVFELNSYFLVSIAFLISILPYFVIVMFFIICFQVYILTRSYKIIIETKECDSIQKSPLFDFFKNTLNGIVQIKLYKQQQYFKSFFNQLSNNCIRSNFTFYQCSTNFGYKVHLSGWFASVIGTMIVIGIYKNKSIFSQALLILTIFNDQFQWCMRQMIQVHAMMSSCQRMYEIIDLTSEAPQYLEQVQNWPSVGQVKFEQVELRYRYNTPLILKGINFEIPYKKRIGIIGRTGAGKSSILQAMFRMSEIEKGQIIIDDVNIQKLGLHQLRSSIGIIPQSPFLFSGSIRRNLDPFNEYSDKELWDALQQTSLDEYIRKLPNKLGSDMTQVNSIFSVGQKQLICLVRIILSKKKIIVLDEATANLDQKTDDLIQLVISKFDATIITIAHRLNTIADYDYVMVMQDGKIIEYDRPLMLLCNSIEDLEITKNTEFAQMVKATGNENSKVILKLAKRIQN
ncbi:unnamed protein product [Paramecium primaurelia]|uniref:Uncharacterized protein n=1 Tax=Paramecium primaurelia TaxID=5886 RepID=A0A8S1QKH2_PARPR|nr:unnamed protein product [Paramecium primaurelia]